MFLHQCWSLFFNYRLENCNCFNKETQTQLFSCDFYEFLLDSLTHFIPFPKVQKRSPRSVLSKKCSEKFRKFYRKTPVPESFFNKVVGLKPATLLKKRLWYRCFPVNFVKFLRTLFFTEHLWTTASNNTKQQASCLLLSDDFFSNYTQNIKSINVY